MTASVRTISSSSEVARRFLIVAGPDCDVSRDQSAENRVEVKPDNALGQG